MLLDTTGWKDYYYPFIRIMYLLSFGHEIGHNFGADHNPEEYSSPSGDGYGHLILVSFDLF